MLEQKLLSLLAQWRIRYADLGSPVHCSSALKASSDVIDLFTVYKAPVVSRKPCRHWRLCATASGLEDRRSRSAGLGLEPQAVQVDLEEYMWHEQRKAKQVHACGGTCIDVSLQTLPCRTVPGRACVAQMREHEGACAIAG
ncbi:MAG: hypothetical protein ACYYK0_05705 [Candidatus Eutrophobiaceae bacterium]